MKIGQHEQAWKPAKEEFKTIDVGNEKIKRELKIGTLITPKRRRKVNCTTPRYRFFFPGRTRICLVCIGYH
jgi:hypothetical protein